MIILNHSLALTLQASPLGNAPIIGWHNLVTQANVSADTEADAGHAATNLALPDTSFFWRAADTSEQHLTFTIDSGSAEVDYLGIARHNFGTAGVALTVEARATSGDSHAEVVGEHMVADDGPLIFRFTSASRYEVRLKLSPDAVVPEAASAYVGKLLQVDPGYAGPYRPLPHARATDYVSARSIAGDFLARFKLGETRRSPITFAGMDGDWYRANMAPFIAALDRPFFFASHPVTRPLEAGFAWTLNDPQPTEDDRTGWYSIELDMEGVA